MESIVTVVGTIVHEDLNALLSKWTSLRWAPAKRTSTSVVQGAIQQGSIATCDGQVGEWCLWIGDDTCQIDLGCNVAWNWVDLVWRNGWWCVHEVEYASRHRPSRGLSSSVNGS